MTAQPLRPAIFLDRDGVLNANVVIAGKAYAPIELGAFRLLPGVADAGSRLKAAGYLLVVATNQPDIGAGRQSWATVEAMHTVLRAAVLVDAIKVCPHRDGDGCQCRKPRPGLLLEAAAELGIDLARSWMIGDRWRDVDAGRAAGCRTVLVRADHAEAGSAPDFEAADLPEAAERILAPSDPAVRSEWPHAALTTFIVRTLK